MANVILTDTEQAELKRLRAFLNPAIKGPTVDAVLTALAKGTGYLVDSVEAASEQIYIATATDRYLDQRLADYGLVRPANVGLGDDVYREIGTNVVNRKQVRDLIEELLLAIFGNEATNATSRSSVYEPYNLDPNDTLILSFDGQDKITVNFTSAQFQNIDAATAQEVSDAITREIRKQGKTGRAFAKNDGTGSYVVLISDTMGPSSTITVLGGRSQNVLKFNSVRPTTNNSSTTWTVSQVAGGKLRYTWTSGANPGIGKIRVNDYVNIYGAAFNVENRGTFTIDAFKGGTIGNAYFEIDNPNGTSQVTPQGTAEAMLFFFPETIGLNSKSRYAAVYQSEASLLEIFIPATTKVVRRDRVGSAHLHDQTDPVSLLPNQEGPYMYDLSQPFVIGNAGTTSTTQYDPDTGRVIFLNDSSNFPDSEGLLILGYGTSHQEGPVPYLARPSNKSLLLSPSYKIKNIHPVGTDIALISKNGPVTLSKQGLDWQFYLTSVTDGRIYAQDLINTVAATGIKVVITILYPSDIGLAKGGTIYSEKTIIWGND